MLVLRLESSFYNLIDDYRNEPSNASYLGLALIADQYDAYVGDDVKTFDRANVYDKVEILSKTSYVVKVITQHNRQKKFSINNINELIEAYQLAKRLTKNLTKEEEHTILINDEDIENYKTKRKYLKYEPIDQDDVNFGTYIKNYQEDVKKYGHFSYQGVWCRSLHKINPVQMLALLSYDRSASYSTLYSFKDASVKFDEIDDMVQGYTKVHLVVYDTDVYITNKDYDNFLNVIYKIDPNVKITRFGKPLKPRGGIFSFIKSGISTYMRYIDTFYHFNVTPMQYFGIVSCLRNLDATVVLSDNPSYQDLTVSKLIQRIINYDNKDEIKVRSSTVRRDDKNYYKVRLDLKVNETLKNEFILAYTSMLRFILAHFEQNTSSISSASRIRNEQNREQILINDANIKLSFNTFPFDLEILGINDEIVGKEIYDYYSKKYSFPIQWDGLNPIWAGINLESYENWTNRKDDLLLLFYHDKLTFIDGEEDDILYFNHNIKNKSVDYVNGLIYIYNQLGLYIINSDRALFVNGEDDLDNLDITDIPLRNGAKVSYDINYFNNLLRNYPVYLPKDPKYIIISDVGNYYVSDKTEFEKGVDVALTFVNENIKKMELNVKYEDYGDEE